MTDRECVTFLQWALPRMSLRWPGYRKVRSQVCKRIQRRVAELGLPGVQEYRARLERDPVEWQVLDGLCVVTISRFYRDRVLWQTLQGEVLPAVAESALAARDTALRCWSIGCASGEEPFTLSILWQLGLGARRPALGLRILATDVDENVLARARAGIYEAGSTRELPAGWREEAFARSDGLLLLRDRFRTGVDFRPEDVRLALPDERFHLVLCRNVVFTYFDEAAQRHTLDRILTRMADGGALVVGQHERPPAGTSLEPWHARLGIYRRR